jgi:hypothetical protein
MTGWPVFVTIGAPRPSRLWAAARSAWVSCERYHSEPFGSTLIEPKRPIEIWPPSPSPPVVAAVE